MIPAHNFIYDDQTSIPFRFESIDFKNEYNVDLPHRHNYYEIFLFEKGRGKHIIDLIEFEITDHSLHFIAPGQIHQVARTPDSNGSVIMFSREFMHGSASEDNILFQLPFLSNFSKNPTIPLSKEEFEKFILLFNNMKTEFTAAEKYNSDVIKSYLQILLVQCERRYSQSTDTAFQSEEHMLTQRFIRLLEKGFTEFQQVQHYAAELMISPDKLNKTCKKTIGKGAGEMIKERILLEAKRMLTFTQYSAKEISYQLNFNDPSHFNKWFKKATNQTPTEFSVSAKEIYHT